MLNPSNRKWLPPQMPLQLSSTSKFHNFYVPALNVNKTTFSLNNDYKNCIYSNHVKVDSNEYLSSSVIICDLLYCIVYTVWSIQYLIYSYIYQCIFFLFIHSIHLIWPLSLDCPTGMSRLNYLRSFLKF